MPSASLTTQVELLPEDLFAEEDDAPSDRRMTRASSLDYKKKKR